MPQRFGPAAPGCFLLLVFMAGPSAHALPAFAAQTGQACQMCHVGGFGPHLTPYGQSFKMQGYTQRTTPSSVALSAMAETSFVHTAKDQPPAPELGPNDNFAIDQISLFVAGAFTPHIGAFIQATYDGVAHSFAWDNLDVRAATWVKVGDEDVLAGISVNNNPTLSDPWNTLPAWGFPYSDSALRPAPSASPLLDGGLAQTTLGVTEYAWIANAVYLEIGAYGSPSASLLRHLGADPTSPGSIAGIAPYGRIAYQAPLADGVAEAGTFAMDTRIHPGLDTSTGFVDRYTDTGLDASWYRAWRSGDVVTVNFRYTHESQSLRATCVLAQADPSCANDSLDDIRADLSYYWRNRIGGTLQVFNTSGGANPVIYAGNRSLTPDSTGLTFQIDGTPFGHLPQPMRRLNLRAGLQYTLYTRFNGAAGNFDGHGGNASDNDTLRVFVWAAL